MEDFVTYLGLLFIGLAIVYGVVLYRAGMNSHTYHLIWVAVLAVFFYAHLPFVEKIHIAIFGLFGFLSQKLFEQIVAAILCVAISGLDELLQHFLVTRVGDWRDVWLNLFASALGMFLAYLLFENRQKHVGGDSV
jgi:VanZ family protein